MLWQKFGLIADGVVFFSGSEKREQSFGYGYKDFSGAAVQDDVQTATMLLLGLKSYVWSGANASANADEYMSGSGATETGSDNIAAASTKVEDEQLQVVDFEDGNEGSPKRRRSGDDTSSARKKQRRKSEDGSESAASRPSKSKSKRWGLLLLLLLFSKPRKPSC